MQIRSGIGMLVHLLTLRQETDFPAEETTVLTIRAQNPVETTVYLRYPSWSNPTGFNPEIFSSRRIVVAPAVTVIGFVLMIFGILKNSKNKEVAE